MFLCYHIICFLLLLRLIMGAGVDPFILAYSHYIIAFLCITKLRKSLQKHPISNKSV